jgi:hypothetical protein
VHPIERLRYVARSGGADQQSLVREAAGSLAAMDVDPAGLVTACRRIVQRHPAAGTVWTLCARVLTDVDGLSAAWDVVGDVSDDRTGVDAVDVLPDEATVLIVGWTDLVPSGFARRGDLEVLVVDVDGAGAALADRLVEVDVDAVEVPVAGVAAAAAEAEIVVLEADLAGPTGAVVPTGSRAAAAVCRSVGGTVHLVVGSGRLLPGRTWDAASARVLDGVPWEADMELLPVDLVDVVVRPTGSSGAEALAGTADAPVAPELLVDLGW